MGYQKGSFEWVIYSTYRQAHQRKIEVHNTPLPDHSGRHHNCSASFLTLELVYRPSHGLRIFDTTLPSNSVRTSAVCDNSSHPLPFPRIQHRPTDNHRGCLEDILGEDRCRRTRRLRGEQRKVQ